MVSLPDWPQSNEHDGLHPDVPTEPFPIPRFCASDHHEPINTPRIPLLLFLLTMIFPSPLRSDPLFGGILCDASARLPFPIFSRFPRELCSRRRISFYPRCYSPTASPMLLSALTAQLAPRPSRAPSIVPSNASCSILGSRSADLFVAIRGERMDAQRFVPELDVAAVIADAPVLRA